MLTAFENVSDLLLLQLVAQHKSESELLKDIEEATDILVEGAE